MYCKRYICLWDFISVLIFGVGLMCVCKLNALCDECCTWRTKCKYPGKTSIRAGSGMGAGLLTKGQPVIVVPPPKCESLEVRCQEVAVWEWANELTEACLEVDCDMVCANVGVLLVVQVCLGSLWVWVGWVSVRRALPRKRGKGRRGLWWRMRGRGQVRVGVGVAQMTGLREGVTGTMMAVMRMGVMMMPLLWSI